MKRLTVAVSASAGRAGSTLTTELQRQGHVVIRLEARANDAESSDGVFIHVPLARDSSFASTLVEVMLQLGCDVWIPVAHEEVAVAHLVEPELREAGTCVWAASESACNAVMDKLSFWHTCESIGVAAAPTWRFGDPPLVDGDCIVKPRFGCGSRGVGPMPKISGTGRVLFDEEMVVQPSLGGREFSVDCIVSRDHRVLGGVMRYRLIVDHGVCVHAETFYDPRLFDCLQSMVTAIGITAFVNMQGFMTSDGPVVLEVNPRFSGGFGASLAAGSDLVGQYLRGALGLSIDEKALSYESGLSLVRRGAEYVPAS